MKFFGVGHRLKIKVLDLFSAQFLIVAEDLKEMIRNKLCLFSSVKDFFEKFRFRFKIFGTPRVHVSPPSISLLGFQTNLEVVGSYLRLFVST